MDLKLPTTKRYDLIKLLGGKCRMCPEDNPSKIELDHIYNDGDVERTKYGSAEKIWGYYLEHKELAFERIQPLCKEHHKEKTYNNNNEEEEMSNVDLNRLQNPPDDYLSKYQVFQRELKDLETPEKIPVPIDDLSNRLFSHYNWSKDEVSKYLRRMLREAAIYESRPQHFNTI